ncbi:acetylornithine carbamoyltransferase [Chryseobacterium sp. 6424]|uniref:acetylornithine carbamoyltransferase n=1 Tax=Chryseobacterium sp. 6424 TaxID=2039166 RepID=UPI000EFA7D87|nr:acetylornithine carbamoyltransferase [Chryseobacterium sp. 6424]AYO57672.1 acetylornithine carbamoyltransferase [Chryseobacterium sp. 6424]
MKNFTSVHDISNPEDLVQEALELKKNLYGFSDLGKNKTLGLVFLNPSLRTRMSSQKAGMNLGMQVQVINAGQDAWNWEFAENAVMDGSTVEHIKDAAKVLSEYCDVIGLRCFPGLKDRNEDYSEFVLNLFIKYATVPVISLESATRHPLQSFADLITIRENWTQPHKPKVVLSWAPHIKALPQAVGNSFAEWMNAADVDFCIANPKGYDLSKDFSGDATVYHNQEEALKDADFVYVKNWSSFDKYGTMPEVKENWLLGEQFLKANPETKFMHCLPVRRNLEMSDAVLDSANSLIYQQANNRTLSAQLIIKKILENSL